MANEHKSGDEITLYILSWMYRKYAFVYTQMFWWTTLLYTWLVQEKDLMEKCEIVLVFLKPGVFGELHKIRPPTAAVPTLSVPALPSLSSVIPQNAKPNVQDTVTAMTTTTVITEGTTDTNPVPPGSTAGTSVTPGNPERLTTLPVTQGHTEATDLAAPTLLNIDIFMTQCCSIPLIRCDYASVLKAVDTYMKETVEESAGKSDSSPTKSTVLEHPIKVQQRYEHQAEFTL